MCGIFGIWNVHKQSVDMGFLLDSLNSIRHRGPDDEGYLLINSHTQDVASCLGPESAAHVRLPRIEDVFNPQFDIAFGFRRLSILDLSPSGHQPMSNSDGSLWIVFNGEIYNYIELRAELQAQGYVFHTQTDTEVILNAYDAWGVECLNRFNGMWGFALFDKRRKRLFCARDRFGIKPFYYFFDGERFLFASEIKALLANPGISRKPNDAVIYDYLAYGLLDHTEETFFSGIMQLPPAHYLILEDSNISIRRYWDLDSQNKLDLGMGEKADKEYARRFYDLFEDSIRLHLRSDVAIGSCLSGGLDSSSIVCVANKLLFKNGVVSPEAIGEKQKTFSSCFEDSRFDERQHIDRIISVTSAETNNIFPGPENLLDELPKLMKHQDEPFGSTSQYAQWCVMKLASEHGIRVLLDGQGADELLAGYHPFFDSFWATLASQGNGRGLLREWSAYNQMFGASPWYLIQHTLFALAPVGLQRQARFKRGTRSINPEFSRVFQGRFPDENINYSGSSLSKRLYLSTTRTSLPALLRYEDRSSMAHSIEARVPFLDYRLVEYIFSLSDHQKIRNGYTKAVLRESMRNVLPEQNRMRKDKMGFVTPEHVWLTESLRSWLDDIINSVSFRNREYFNFPQIIKLLDDYRSQRRDIGFMVWRWVNLELWLNKNS
jgi:asparagine synthase (glutamine-hydrolysing)